MPTSEWDTIRPLRRVLVVVRTPATLRRLQDVVQGLLGDHRVEVRFTVDKGSEFSGGLPDRLTGAGALLMPWQEACRARFDLALAASDKSALHLIDAPVVLMPHGAGYHRRSTTDPDDVSGLRRSAFIADDSVLPHTVVVAHEHQVATLATVDPRLAKHAMVTADPCLDRVVASESLRLPHRRSFAAGNRRMVLLCSTWGPNSLFGTDLRLAERLVTTLPADEFRVAMTLHPNIWRRHGRMQVLAWLRPAIAAGLALLPQDEDWRPGLLAADVVVSDHGSLTCYAAAAGRPVLLATNGGPEVVPGSPLAGLLAALPTLHPGTLTGPLPTPVADEVTAAVFRERGTSATALNQLFYRIMNLPDPPTRAVPEPVPPAEIEIAEPTHYRTTVRHTLFAADHVHLSIERTTARWPEPSAPLSAEETTPDLAILESATSVWTNTPFPDTETATDYARGMLHRFPGTRLTTAATQDQTIATLRDGTVITAHTTTTLSATTAALHWWSTAPRRPHHITLEAGASSGVIRL
ncbi:hypothetical protein V5P93_004630 [Actinokineospora auranticolor]|uniref:hypothetical protein n=1 Tax=Actinokineospora auranticolor TaxID=155976 RepID=UPI000CEC8B98|nr:hypothetical protein [Actinokineospora auranticolor]